MRRQRNISKWKTKNKTKQISCSLPVCEDRYSILAAETIAVPDVRGFQPMFWVGLLTFVQTIKFHFLSNCCRPSLLTHGDPLKSITTASYRIMGQGIFFKNSQPSFSVESSLNFQFPGCTIYLHFHTNFTLQQKSRPAPSHRHHIAKAVNTPRCTVCHSSIPPSNRAHCLSEFLFSLLCLMKPCSSFKTQWKRDCHCDTSILTVVPLYVATFGSDLHQSMDTAFSCVVSLCKSPSKDEWLFFQHIKWFLTNKSLMN